MTVRRTALAQRDSKAGDDTFPKLLIRQAAVRPNAPAFREKQFGIWQSYSWRETLAQVERIALGLKANGFERGDKLAIIGQNRPHLYWATHAAQALGGLPVPLFADAIANELANILNHCEARFAIVEDQEQVDKLLPNLGDIPNLKRIYYVDPRGMRSYRHEKLDSLEALTAKGDDHAQSRPGCLVEEVEKGVGSDISIICYTSGTTGNPKGVMLTFDSLVTTAARMAGFEGLNISDRTLAYLPMAWIGDHFFSFAQSSIVGFTVNCPESPATVLTDLREIGPTYFFAPPRIFEGFLTDVTVRMQNASSLKRWLYEWSMRIASRSGTAILEGKRVSVLDRALYYIGQTLVFKPLLNTLGLSRLRVAYTAGEALGPEIFNFFRSLGINLKQLYGQTECTHPTSAVLSCVGYSRSV